MCGLPNAYIQLRINTFMRRILSRMFDIINIILAKLDVELLDDD